MIDPFASVIYTGTKSDVSNSFRKGGAAGFLLKPYLHDDLTMLLYRAAADLAVLSQKGSQPLLGNSPAMQYVRERILLYAECDLPVLILGESGTGKELAANTIHKFSKRASETFLPVDCASIPENLVETFLFGASKGAYTDAIEKEGAFEAANKGSIFLDEIGELSKQVQVRFLRVLETGTGNRVGSFEQIQYDVRIISATNARLHVLRDDLLHRINTLTLEMPALRKHKEDIPFLANSFLTEYEPKKELHNDALNELINYNWPGNARELRNTIQRAVVLSGTEETIMPSHIELNFTIKDGLF
jgi:DNA-binding NtrC family response regulator